MKLADRTGMIAPSYTLGISTKVLELNNQGRRIISFGAGEPDFNIPEKAKSAAVKALQNNFTKYDAVPGLIQLRTVICDKLREENNIKYEPDQIVVSTGAKQAVMNATLAVVNPGDEVMIVVPYWTSYPEIIKLCGGVPVVVEPADKVDYKLTVEDLKKAVTDKTKMLFFNNPSNPSGVVYTEEEVREIGEFCLENEIWIMSDEIYERFCFDREFCSMASISEEIKDITIVINGFSKSAAMTGLRIGYTASTKEIAKAISKMQGHLTSHPSTLSQWVAYAALMECRDEINAQIQMYNAKRNYVMKRLDAMKDITYLKPEGAFYVMINLGAYKDKIGYTDSYSAAICNRMIEDAEVAFVPGIAFGLDDYVRMSYASSSEDIEKGLNRLEKFINSL